MEHFQGMSGAAVARGFLITKMIAGTALAIDLASPPAIAQASAAPEPTSQASTPLRIGPQTAPSKSELPEPDLQSTQKDARQAPTRISLPPLLGGQRLSAIMAEITLTELLGIEGASLLVALGDRIDDDTRLALEQRKSEYLTVDDLAQLGVTASYKPNELSIVLAILPSARGPQRFSIANQFDFSAAARAMPAEFATGFTGTLIGGRDFSAGSVSDRLIYDFAGFANVGGRDGVYVTYGGTFNIAGGGGLFERNRIIVFKDFESAILRVSAGDLVPQIPIIAGDVEILGVSAERRYDAIQPLRNIRPTGRRTFSLDSPARIEIYANGALVQTIDASPGEVDLNQIPALSLTSNISIIVEDTTGRREIDSFTLANDIELLAEGISEFSFSAGALRRFSTRGFAYTDNPVATGQYIKGFSEKVTAGGHFIVAQDYQNVGLRAAVLGLRGAIFSGISVSRATGSTGYAASLAYRGDPLQLSDLGGQLNFRFDYQSRGYRRLSLFQVIDNVKFDIAADYRINLTTRIGISFGGTYFERYNQPDKTRALFGGVQVSFGRLLLSATARYAKIGPRTDTGVLATATLPLGRSHFANASFDTGTEQARLEVRRQRDITIPEFDYGVIAESNPLFDRLTGQTRFANSRVNLDVEFTNVQPRGMFGARNQNIGQFRLQSGFAYADGEFGIGRNPGRGFVMVNRHPSLRRSPIDIENSGVGRRSGQINGLGPAVISQLSGYRPDPVRVDVLNAPTGYDIGPGEYISDPGALSGVKITVGSDAFRTVIVTLTNPDGVPVALSYGTVRNLLTGKTDTFFTNAAGRAVFSQVSPGRYRVEFMDSDLTYDFVVSEDAAAIIQSGVQAMEVMP
ncbi:fimbria/pilus outer membrane usher protein [Blastomonas sp. RAC04]|uniref:fimbria/pilus outer membrane usher protein n=1 Tax=Blastomonas sp. RAC04 TaxID=1842535 RepID=UPI0012372125|nr:fimbria/pilus outer membrane usher protein [Blastomonas sp. RAC04]